VDGQKIFSPQHSLGDLQWRVDDMVDGVLETRDNPIEDHIVELRHCGGDVGEAGGEVAELAGLQVHAVVVAEGQWPEASCFGSNDQPGPTAS
jgi:hypothetical protein